MNIGIDIMGGDYAPLEAIQGLIAYFEDSNVDPNVRFTLFGDQYKAGPYITHLSNYIDRFEVVHCDDVIEMHEHPTKALKDKPRSSIGIGFHYLQSGKIDAFASAGNTGAMMVGAMYSVKALPGIIRPTIASPIPKLNGNFNFLLDVGLNADCKPEHLAQFAQMGAIYAENVLQSPNPKVGLLNIGEEEGKGNILTQATYPLLKDNTAINFIGNIEGRDVFMDNCDVIVCEGFTGNTLLKMAESFYQIFKQSRNIEDEFLETFNYENYGGTPVLGIGAPVIIGHGISRAIAFKNMYRTAIQMVSSNVTSAIRDAFATQVNDIDSKS